MQSLVVHLRMDRKGSIQKQAARTPSMAQCNPLVNDLFHIKSNPPLRAKTPKQFLDRVELIQHIPNGPHRPRRVICLPTLDEPSRLRPA